MSIYIYRGKEEERERERGGGRDRSGYPYIGHSPAVFKHVHLARPHGR